VVTRKMARTLPKTTVLDVNGNPLQISAVICYFFTNSKKATLDVSNAHEFVHAQAEAVLKKVVAKFPYESHEDDRPCLKKEAELVSRELCVAFQEAILPAGAAVHSFQLKEISYAPEIAQGMLRKQQASSLVAARHAIVEGAVDIVVDAVSSLQRKNIRLNEIDRSRLVSNVMTVVCAERDPEPVNTVQR